MSEIVDRVALAILRADVESSLADYPDNDRGEVHAMAYALFETHHKPMAIAAIEAMRQPTGRMLDMGQHFYDKTSCGLMDIGPDSALHEAWDRMIDEALK
jgi:hypothetical protein